MASSDMKSKRPRSKGKKGLHNKDPRVPKKTSGTVSGAASQMAVKAVKHHVQRLELTIMPEEDFDKKFFRCTNGSEEHNGYVWKDGLNVDFRPFSTTVECGPGGLYFTDFSHIPDWMSRAQWIREVTPVLDGGGVCPRAAHQVEGPCGHSWPTQGLG